MIEDPDYTGGQVVKMMKRKEWHVSFPKKRERAKKRVRRKEERKEEVTKTNREE